MFKTNYSSNRENINDNFKTKLNTPYSKINESSNVLSNKTAEISSTSEQVSKKLSTKNSMEDFEDEKYVKSIHQ